jgi:serine/threonine protein kinase/WD40 repeat protein
VNLDQVDFSELRRRLSGDFGFEVSLKYEDEDGDHITLSTQNDFEGLAHGRHENETINVYVSECKPLPTLKHPGTMSRENSQASLSFSRSSSQSSLMGGAGGGGDGSLSPPKGSRKKAPLTIDPSILDLPTQVDSVDNNTNNSGDNNGGGLGAGSMSNFRSPVAMTLGSVIPMSPLSNRDRSLFRVGSFNSNVGRFPNMEGDQRDRSGSVTSLASSNSGGGTEAPHQQQKDIRWKKGEMLGQGAFGVVYLGLNVDTGELMAVKQLSREEVSGKEINSLENEIKLLQSFWHPNIVRYIGTEFTNQALSIFLEYVPGGSLKALINKFGSLEESVTQTYTRQLLLGLEYLHNNGIAHRDIKGGNCLVGNDGVIKLADFGNSKHWRAKTGTGSHPNGLGKKGFTADNHSTGTSNDIKGTPSWMAPEVIREQGSGSISWRKADVWSLACTTLEMASGKAPWSQFSNSVTILYHIACQETLPEYPEGTSTELHSFLNMCLQRDPSKRPDISSLLLHPFVAKRAASGWNTAAGAMGCVVRPSTVGQTISNSNVGQSMNLGFEVRDRDSKYGREQRGRTSQSTRAGDLIDVVPVDQGESSRDDDSNMIGNVEKTTESSLDESDNTELAELVGSKSTISGLGASDNHSTFIDDSGVDGDQRRSMVPILNPDMGMDAPPGLEGVFDDSNDEPVGGGLDNDDDNLESSGDALEVSDEVETPRVLIKSAIISRHDLPSVTNKDAGITVRSDAGIIKKLSAPPSDRLEDSGSSESGTSFVSDTNGLDPEIAHPRPKMTAPKTEKPVEEKVSFDSVFPSELNNATQSPIRIPNEEGGGTEGEISPHARGNPLLQQAPQQQPVLSLSPSVKNKKTSPSARRAAARMRAMSDVELTPLSPEQIQRISQQRQQRHVAEERLKYLQSNTQTQMMRSSPVNIMPLHPQARSGAQPLGLIGSQRSNHQRLVSNYLETSDSLESLSLDQGSESSLSGAGFDGDYPSVSDIPEGSETSEISEPKWHVPSHNLGPIASFNSEVGSDPLRPTPEKFADLGLEQKNLLTSPPQLIRSNSLIDNSIREKTVRFASNNRMSNNPGLKLIIPDNVSEMSEEQNDDESGHGHSGIPTKVVAANHVPSMSMPLGSLAARDDAGTKKVDDGRKVYQPRTNIKPLDASLHLSADERRKVVALSEGGARVQRLKEVPQSPIRPLSSMDASSLKTVIKSSSTSVLGSPTRLSGGIGGGIENGLTRGTPTRGPPRLRKPNHPASAHPRIGRGILNEDGRDLFHGTGFEYPGGDDGIVSLSQEPTVKALKPGFASAPEASRRSVKSLSQSGGKAREEVFMKARDDGGELNMQPMTSSSPIMMHTRKQPPSHDNFEGSSEIDQTGVSDCDTGDKEEQEDVFDDDIHTGGAQTLKEHTDSVTRLRAPRRTNLLLSSSADGTVKIWGPERRSKATLDATEFVLPGFAGEEKDSSAPSVTRTTGVTNVWAEENCDTIWGACSDNSLRVWSGNDGKGMRFLKGHTNSITAMEGLDGVAGSKGRALVGTGSADKTVRVWDARAKKGQVFLFKGHSDAITTLRWGEGGRSVVTGGKDKTIRIWDTRAGRQRAVLEKHFDAVNTLRAIPEYIKCNAIDGGDGASFVSGGRDAAINLWTADGGCVGSQTAHRSITMLSDINANLAFRPGSPFLFSLSADNMVRLWDLRCFKMATEFSVPGQAVVKAVWAGQDIFTTGSTGDIRRWIASATGKEGGGGGGGKDEITWDSHPLISHTATSTDLISTDKFVASSSKSGEIIRFWGA